MASVTEELKTQLAQLPAPDRAELAAFLIQSLDEEQDTDWEAAWDAELVQRSRINGNRWWLRSGLSIPGDC